MSIAKIVMSSGLSAQQALAINGGVSVVTAAGSTQSDATALTVGMNYVSSGSLNAGVVLPKGAAADEIWVYNGTVNAIFAYPPISAAFNDLAANAGVTVSPASLFIAKCVSATQWNFLSSGATSSSSSSPFIAGIDGQDGDDGAPGVPGAQGAAGAQGAPGVDGRDAYINFGQDGQDGQDGIPGVQGSNGDTGPQGIAGSTIRGEDGQDGLDGLMGAQGNTGATGPAGIDGLMIRGLDGQDGEDGMMGIPGAAGATGASGSSGANGENGIPGNDGQDGDNGIFGNVLNFPGTTSVFLRGDGLFAVPSGGGGGGSITAATVSVTTPALETSVTVTDASITATSKIVVGWGNCSQADANHPGMGEVGFNAVPGTGNFSLEMFSTDSSMLYGDFKINYTSAA